MSQFVPFSLKKEQIEDGGTISKKLKALMNNRRGLRIPLPVLGRAADSQRPTVTSFNSLLLSSNCSKAVGAKFRGRAR